MEEHKGGELGTGTVRAKSSRTPSRVWTPPILTFFAEHLFMKLSVLTTIASIGSASLSSVVVSAVSGAPRGF